MENLFQINSSRFFFVFLRAQQNSFHSVLNAAKIFSTSSLEQQAVGGNANAVVGIFTAAAYFVATVHA